VIIFDCNGVLVDSEQIAAAAAADEFARAGISITPELVTRYFSGRRPADMLAQMKHIITIPYYTEMVKRTVTFAVASKGMHVIFFALALGPHPSAN